MGPLRSLYLSLLALTFAQAAGSWAASGWVPWRRAPAPAPAATGSAPAAASAVESVARLAPLQLVPIQDRGVAPGQPLPHPSAAQQLASDVQRPAPAPAGAPTQLQELQAQLLALGVSPAQRPQEQAEALFPAVPQQWPARGLLQEQMQFPPTMPQWPAPAQPQETALAADAARQWSAPSPVQEQAQATEGQRSAPLPLPQQTFPMRGPSPHEEEIDTSGLLQVPSQDRVRHAAWDAADRRAALLQQLYPGSSQRLVTEISNQMQPQSMQVGPSYVRATLVPNSGQPA
mmetsp:Transcript_16237/g.47423  ORF Transcript_16237/g.47423 Transcript_16237/m.47423 type:complete len:288 (+) Transcript_16237:78-941(+)